MEIRHYMSGSGRGGGWGLWTYLYLFKDLPPYLYKLICFYRFYVWAIGHIEPKSMNASVRDLEKNMVCHKVQF